jgi:hypothetical protein
MPVWVFAHLRQNIVAYVALFVAVGGTSYAAVRLKPGSVTSAALARRSVTHAKLGANSVTSFNVKAGSLSSSDFKSASLVDSAGAGAAGKAGLKGDKGDPGPQGPAGAAGGATTTFRTRAANAVNAPHGASTAVPLAGDSWTQAAGELNLVAGVIKVQTPASCTGSFGNALVISVDGNPTSIGIGPTVPASSSVTVPIAIGTLMEPAAATPHRLTASFGNSCTKAGEDFAVSDVRLDIIRVP